MQQNRNHLQRPWGWWTSRLGICIVTAGLSRASLVWLRVQAMPKAARALLPSEGTAIVVTVGLAFLAAGPAWAWVRRAGRAIRSRLLDKSVWALAGAAAGIPFAVAETWVAILIVLLIVVAAICFTRLPASASPPSDREQPISKSVDDWVGRGFFVDALANCVAKGPEPVIALYGALGSGKSSVLRLLEGKLRKSYGENLIVRFSAWLPPDADSLVRDLLESIEDAVSRLLWWPDFARASRGLAAAVGAYRPLLGSMARLFQEPSQAARLERLTNALCRLPCRVIVLIDEIDRMDRPELEELFKLLRGAADIENVCILCALDRENAARIHSGPGVDGGALGRSREYLEKFFAIHFNLPAPDEGRMHDELVRRIQLAFAQSPALADKDALLTNIGLTGPGWRFYGKMIATPRRLKALARVFTETASLSTVGLNALDLFNLLLLLELGVDPESDLHRHADLLVDTGDSFWTDSPVSGPIDLLGTNAEARDKTLGRFVGALRDRPAGGDIVDLMGLLFPRIREASKKSDGPSAPVTEAGGATREFRMSRPRHFYQYLTLCVPGSQFSSLEFAELMRALAGDAKARLDQAVMSAGGTKALKCWDLVSQLAQHEDEIPRSAREVVVVEAAGWARQMEDGIFASPRGSALRLIFRLVVVANKNDGPAEAERLLLAACSELSDDPKAVAQLTDPQLTGPGLGLEGVDLGQVRRSVAANYAQYFHARSGTPAAVFSEEDIVKFRAWVAWAGSGDRTAAAYLHRHLDVIPSDIVGISRSFGDNCKIRAGNLRQLVGAQLPDLVGRLEHIVGGSGVLNAEETAEISELKSCLEASAAAGQN